MIFVLSEEKEVQRVKEKEEQIRVLILLVYIYHGGNLP